MLVVRPPSGIVLVEEHIIGGLMLHRTPLAGGVSLVITLRAERQRGVDTIAVFMRHDGRSCRDSSGSCTGAIILKKCLLRKELRVGGLIMETRKVPRFLYTNSEKREAECWSLESHRPTQARTTSRHPPPRMRICFFVRALAN
jgi:hypothetical protein